VEVVVPVGDTQFDGRDNFKASGMTIRKGFVNPTYLVMIRDSDGFQSDRERLIHDLARRKIAIRPRGMNM
jgi:hypothetical protein